MPRDRQPLTHPPTFHPSLIPPTLYPPPLPTFPLSHSPTLPRRSPIHSPTLPCLSPTYSHMPLSHSRAHSPMPLSHLLTHASLPLTCALVHPLRRDGAQGVDASADTDRVIALVVSSACGFVRGRAIQARRRSPARDLRGAFLKPAMVSSAYVNIKLTFISISLFILFCSGSHSMCASSASPFAFFSLFALTFNCLFKLFILLLFSFLHCYLIV
jgi:hypothetical protein